MSDVYTVQRRECGITSTREDSNSRRVLYAEVFKNGQPIRNKDGSAFIVSAHYWVNDPEGRRKAESRLASDLSREWLRKLPEVHIEEALYV